VLQDPDNILRACSIDFLNRIAQDYDIHQPCLFGPLFNLNLAFLIGCDVQYQPQLDGESEKFTSRFHYDNDSTILECDVCPPVWFFDDFGFTAKSVSLNILPKPTIERLRARIGGTHLVAQRACLEFEVARIRHSVWISVLTPKSGPIPQPLFLTNGWDEVMSATEYYELKLQLAGRIGTLMEVARGIATSLMEKLHITHEELSRRLLDQKIESFFECLSPEEKKQPASQMVLEVDTIRCELGRVEEIFDGEVNYQQLQGLELDVTQLEEDVKKLEIDVNGRKEGMVGVGGI
jgi:hypothetical protein